MELLDAANTGAYGHPEPTAVRVTPVEGKAILVSGHDLKDLEALLRADRGQGHQRLHPRRDAAGARLPGCKKYPHLVGNYGGAWQDQREGVRRLPRRRS